MKRSDAPLKVLLIGINSAWYQSNPALYYLRNAISDLDMDIRIIELILSEPLPDVLARLYQEKAGAYCFSAYIWNREYLEKLIPELKKLLPEARIVLGGPEAAQGDFGLSRGDHIVIGPGEGAFRKLAESGFALPGGIHEAAAPHLNDIPFPYSPADKHALQNKLVYYECSRGCPFHCVYCLSALDGRNEARFDPSRESDRNSLYKELDRLLELEPRTLKFVDRSFNINPQLARLIWDYAILREQACEFHFEIYPELVRDEDILLLEKAPPDRIRFETGIQSVDPEVNETCGRGSNWPQARGILKKLRQRTNVCIHADLLAGLPGEGIDSILNSLDELAATFPHEIQLGLLKILPDTPMLAIARRRGYIWMDRPPYQVLASDALSFDDISRLQDLARVVNLYWNKGEFASEWKEYLSRGNKASSLLLSLLDLHHSRSLPLHSISKRRRGEIFDEVFGDLI